MREKRKEKKKDWHMHARVNNDLIELFSFPVVKYLNMSLTNYPCDYIFVAVIV
jgi:hypothetical protein